MGSAVNGPVMNNKKGGGLQNSMGDGGKFYVYKKRGRFFSHDERGGGAQKVEGSINTGA